MSTKIEKLTKKQVAKIPEYVEHYTNVGLSLHDDTLATEEVERIIREVYRYGKIDQPKRIIRTESPLGAIVEAQKLGATEFLFAFGAADADDSAYFAYMREILGLVEQTEVWEGYKQTQALGWFLPYRDVCVVANKPIAIHTDDSGLLHNAEGLAIEYSDGFGLYSWHGVILSGKASGDNYSWIITNPELITFEVINQENNVEIKRIMIERLGHKKYLESGNATLIHSDARGELYEIDLGPDHERAKVVKVVNSSENPDGSRDIYYIPVPPHIKTATEAVASTFSDQYKYDPVVET